MAIIKNPDGDFVAEMKRELKANNGHCPCSLIKSKDTKYPCKDFRDMEEGAYHCGLYIKTKETE